MFAGNFPGVTQTMPLAIYGRFGAGDMSTALLLSVVSALRVTHRAPGRAYHRRARAGRGLTFDRLVRPRRGKRSLIMRLATLPRYPLATLPTPLQRARNLETALGPRCPRIYLKRDDLTGLAFGGNKARKLEYLLADALANEATTLVTEGAAQSNHARITAAAAAIAGLRSVLVLDARHGSEVAGNLLLDHLLGAEVRIVPDKAARYRAHGVDWRRAARGRRATLRDPDRRQRADRGRRVRGDGCRAAGAIGELPARRRAGSISRRGHWGRRPDSSSGRGHSRRRSPSTVSPSSIRSRSSSPTA